MAISAFTINCRLQFCVFMNLISNVNSQYFNELGTDIDKIIYLCRGVVQRYKQNKQNKQKLNKFV